MLSRVDRREFKFVLPIGMKDEMVSALESRIELDENAGANAYYPIVSQYYDSPDHSCYWEKQDGLNHRRKLRVRVYGRPDETISPSAFIEVKHTSDERGVKRRLHLPLEIALKLAEGDSEATEQYFGQYSRSERMLVNEILQLVEQQNFQPTVAIRYNRLSFQGEGELEALRITFDYDLHCRFRAVSLQPDCMDFDHSILDQDLCIMELKTIGAIPNWFREMLNDFKLRPQSFSKYCTSLERFHPDFQSPHNLSYA